MARVRKTLVRPGRYQTPDGPVDITPERIDGWVKSHRALLAAGIKTPVPYGHQDAARPDEASFLRSRFNAGYLEQLSRGDDGSLQGVLNLPALRADADGNLIDDQAKTAISEVSIAAGAWRDGQGNVWPDIINHVALTPLPVWAGQDGFAQLSTRQPSRLTVLATSPGGFRMASDKDSAFDEISDEGKEKAPLEGMDDNDGDESPPIDDGILTPEMAGPDPMQAQFDTAKALLAEMGVPLPETTAPENFLEHLTVALSVLKGRMQMEQPQPEQAELPEGKAGATPGGKMQAAPTMPQMLSTAQMSPREAKLAAKLNEGKKAQRIAAISRLQSRGLKKDVVDDLTARVGQVRLSLTVDGDILDDEVDRQIALLDKVIPKLNPFTAKLATAAPGKPENPDKPVATIGNDIPVSKSQQDTINEMARMTGSRSTV